MTENNLLITVSAFWGQSFVAELVRISEHGEKKLKLRRESAADALNQVDDRRQAEVADGRDGQNGAGELGREDEVGKLVTSH